MPVERTSKGFKDVSGSFQINPVNNDLIVIKNETAIARSVRNLVLTVPGDKPFAPNIGSRVSEMLFENMSIILGYDLWEKIKLVLWKEREIAKKNLKEKE